MEAYKDVETVAQDLQKCGAARVIRKRIPKVAYKVRNESLPQRVASLFVPARR